MTNEYYNEKDKFQEVIKDLKNLPQVTAPPDFELNLKRKINQLNYKNEKNPVYWFSLKKSFIPVSALAVCAVLVFILFRGKNAQESENPLMTTPPLRNEITNTVPETNDKKLLINPRDVSSNDVVVGKKSITESPKIAARKLEQNTAAEKKVSAKNNEEISSFADSKPKARQFNFNGYENDVDRSLRARPEQYPSSSFSADPEDPYYGNSHNVNFGGFNIIQGDKGNINELRARMDSIKRWMRENNR